MRIRRSPNQANPLHLAMLLVLGGALIGCGDDPANYALPAPLADGDRVLVDIRLPEGAGAGLEAARTDLWAAMAAITGATAPTATVAEPAARVVVELDATSAAFGSQGYSLNFAAGAAPPTLTVTASTDVGAMYGLYALAGDLGARYYHPEETFLPRDAAATLPMAYDGTVSTPHFELRGFHEHTQHPIPMSDYWLRPSDAHRAYVERYITWMARNRQNVASFHLLQTVDFDAWVPYLKGLADDARPLGVKVGMVTSFADEQQNNFKLLVAGATDADSGEPLTEQQQIHRGLDMIAEAGVEVLTLQIGTSEFTKPADVDVIRWLDTAAAHLVANHPQIELFAWIHPPCELESDDGGYFFHVPLQADPFVGAYVHTTMFYDLEHPAPVYGCEDFTHHQEFLSAADGERRQVYFPETAWWLGFDNNMPLVLPITGWTRQNDIQNSLAGHDVIGHVTFTTGREWTYWQYDHYLTQVTWDASLSWSDYLTWLSPAYGDDGPAVANALGAWTELQRQHFFDDDPLVYFYLAGELAQDEIGELAGVLARRPKLSFKTVLEYDDAAFEAWRDGDLALLQRLKVDFDAIDLGALGESSNPLTREVYDALWVYRQRIDHTIALYEGVAAAREHFVATDPSDDDKAAARAAAEAKLASAVEVSSEVATVLAAAESRYRYPIDILARPKPESLTSYKFGYLEETSRAFFWTRRDAQLEAIITRVFDGEAEAWETAPDVVYATDPEQVVMLEPESPFAASIIAGFIPRFLYGLSGFDSSSGDLSVTIGQDVDASNLPDSSGQVLVEGRIVDDVWTGANSLHVMTIYDGAGVELGALVLEDLTYTLDVETDSSDITNVTSGTFGGAINVASFLSIVTTIDGVDEVAASSLIAQAYGLPAGQPLPPTLPIKFALGFSLVE